MVSHRSIASGLKPWQPVYVKKMFHLSLYLITLTGYSARIVYYLNNIGIKPATLKFKSIEYWYMVKKWEIKCMNMNLDLWYHFLNLLHASEIFPASDKVIKYYCYDLKTVTTIILIKVQFCVYLCYLICFLSIPFFQFQFHFKFINYNS